MGSYEYDKKDIIIISCKPLNKDTHAKNNKEEVYIRCGDSCRKAIYGAVCVDKQQYSKTRNPKTCCVDTSKRHPCGDGTCLKKVF